MTVLSIRRYYPAWQDYLDALRYLASKWPEKS